MTIPRYTPPLEGLAPSLFAKLSEVQGSIGAMRPDETVRTDSYTFTYISESQLLTAVRSKLAEHKIAVFVSVESQKSEIVQVTRRNSSETYGVEHAQVSIAATFADGESGETFTILGQGRANDNADKALYKAITSANRYLWWKTMLVPTDSDDANQGEADYGGYAPRAAAGRAEPAAAAAETSAPAPRRPTPTQKRLTENLIAGLKTLDLTRDWDVTVDDWVLKSFNGRGRAELSSAELDSVNKKLEATRDALIAAGADGATFGASDEESAAALEAGGIKPADPLGPVTE